jgi:hypothetical protein
MEPGYFFTQSTRTSGSYWSIEKPGYHKILGYPKFPKDSIHVMWGGFGFGLKGKDILRGFRCPYCKRITFEY